MGYSQDAELFFSAAFQELLGFPPLKWQKRFFFRLAEDRIPAACSLPTGLGKTSIIAIWLIALAYQAESDKGKVKLPRRLFYVVNRRTVVDQATEICEQIRKKLESGSSEIVKRMSSALSSMAAVPGLPVVGISTLRGELADNEEWRLDPCRPAIVVGTIDMIGSKLLFSGYGDSYKVRAFHAGLIGQDALIVHDEAHLVPAFGKLLRTIEQYQRSKTFKPFRVLELSATLKGEDGSSEEVFKLVTEDEEEAFVKRRLEARKCCVLKPADGERSLEEVISETALQYEGKSVRVLVYVHSPESVTEIAKRIAQRIHDQGRVIALTGTMRGFERDRMLRESSVYRAFLEAKPVMQTYYFVANAAGEVGLDLDADHLVCDLQSADRFIQRLGRVNRRGEREAQVYVIYEPEQPESSNSAEASDEDSSARGRSPASHVLVALQQLSKGGCYSEGFDVSPRALSSVKFPPEAFSPSAASVRLDSATLDRWSATTIGQREDISAYLHGLEDAQPETFVAWRAEVDKLVEAVSQADEEEKSEVLQTWFELAPIHSLERLRETASNVHKALKKLAERAKDQHVVLLYANGEVELKHLASLDKSILHYATVVLPPTLGGLSKEGLLDPKSNNSAYDVAEEKELSTPWTRFIVSWDDENQTWQVGRWNSESAQWSFEALADHSEGAEMTIDEASERALRKLSDELQKSLTLVLSLPLRYETQTQEDSVCREALFLAVTNFGKSPQVETLTYNNPPTVEQHCALAEQWAAVLAQKLDLCPEIADALRIAAKYHDLGKARRIWQRAIFNSDFPNQPAWAKSGRRGMNARRLKGYRHELGSLIEAQEKYGLSDDLALHLIAAHHGWSRPLFRETAWDAEYTQETNRKHILEAALRFERLQRRYGWWGLAWLEGLIHIADILASNECKPLEEGATNG